jgi:hypothetical protein
LLIRYGELKEKLPDIERRLAGLRAQSDRSWADVTAAGLQETGQAVGGPWGALIGLAGTVLAAFAGLKKKKAETARQTAETAIAEIVAGIEAAKAGATVDLNKVVMGKVGKDAVDAEQQRLGV